jgi:hypothetical protein
MSIEAIITGALSGESMVLRLANPMVSYSAAHIISIAFDSFGQSELDDAVADAERTTGFNTSAD